MRTQNHFILRIGILFLLGAFLLIPLREAQTATPRALGIISVTPNVVLNAQAAILTITGSDFMEGAFVSLDEYGALSTTYVSTTTLSAFLPAGVMPGIYTVRVTNPDTSSVFLPAGLTVLAATPTPTATIQPVSGYERPLIVVYSYDPGHTTISPGQDFTLYIQLYNAGQKYATNVTATFTPGDLVPRETGGVIAIGDIAPDNRADLWQPLTVSWDVWGKPIATLNMTVNYTDQDGVSYSGQFNLTFNIYTHYGPASTATPTPTITPTPTAKPSYRPQMVITAYRVDVPKLQPGMQFTLHITVQNTGNANAQRLTMIAGGGSSSGSSGTAEPGGVSGASGEFTNFAPLGASNVQFLGDLAAGASLQASQPLIVNVTTNPGAYPMKISFTYVDENNLVYTDDQVITLLVYTLPLVEISFYQDPGVFFTGQPGLIPLQIVNLGRKSVILGNLRVDAIGAQLSNNVILVGALEMGGYFTLDATLIPEIAGPLELIVSVDYTDDFNQPQVISKTLTVEVLESYLPEPGVDGEEGLPGENEPPSQGPETIWQLIWRFILGLLGLDSSRQPSENPSVSPFESQPAPSSPPYKGP